MASEGPAAALIQKAQTSVLDDLTIWMNKLGYQIVSVTDDFEETEDVLRAFKRERGI